eukprot:gnl/MRDRNA2_/MRDRNA2_303105_c0_seq1.p1 gnl/MRDRNA2_/MRDRNA2_303105_c0~~gnl/MRDRNA2_/MRDRNA2_303105_c0_seq1.p1  ORF type:complete len:129 (+),score=19.87 gnl/MRDRNA2_/MRDRNA2_303105_c0_seq1:149-535(+)
MAQAFSMVGWPAPNMLKPATMVDMMVAQGPQAHVLNFQMLMQSLVSMGQIEAGFVLLVSARTVETLLHFGEDCYSLFQTLLDGCSAACHSHGASWLHSAVEELGMIALVPVASIHGDVTQESVERHWW